jgi:hypothetical protein
MGTHAARATIQIAFRYVPTTPWSGLLAVAYIFRGILPER